MRSALYGAVAMASLLLAGGAHAVMAPQYYEEARDSAAYHLEVEITAMRQVSGEAIGTCRVEAVVVSVLRDGSATLQAGDPVAFNVDCLRAGADPSEIPSCVLLQRAERLVDGALLDVYLNKAGEGYSVPLGQVGIINAPSAAEGAS